MSLIIPTPLPVGSLPPSPAGSASLSRSRRPSRDPVPRVGLLPAKTFLYCIPQCQLSALQATPNSMKSFPCLLVNYLEVNFKKKKIDAKIETVRTPGKLRGRQGMIPTGKSF